MQFLHPFHGGFARLLRHSPRLWAILLLAPATLAVTSMSASTAVAAIVTSFALGALTMLAMATDSLRSVPLHLPAAVRTGVCSAVTCLGFGGLFILSAPLACAAIAAYASSAALAHFVRLTPPGQPAVVPQDTEPAPEVPVATTEEVRSMTDAELCQAWRQSFVTLVSTRGPGAHVRVVSLRQALLDEIEVRHPAGLRAWLHSGARAAGGPERFLVGGRDEAGPGEAA